MRSRVAIQENLSNIIVEYTSGTTTLDQMAAKYGGTRHLLSRVLKENGIQRRVCERQTPKLTEDDREIVADLYHVQKLSMKQIGERYGVKQTAMRRYFAKWELDARKPTEYLKRFTLDESYFEKIDSHEKAQILGFIAADGCVLNSRKVRPNYLSIGLHNVDIEYLSVIKQKLGYGGNLKFYKNNVILAIGSEKMAADLVALGITPRKSLTLRFPTSDQVPAEYMSSFILGYFEGDGWISHSIRKRQGRQKRYDGTTVGVLGTRDFLDGINQFLVSLGIRPKTIVQIGNIFRLSLGARNDVATLCIAMYRHASFVMQRKHVKYIEFINNTVPIS